MSASWSSTADTTTATTTTTTTTATTSNLTNLTTTTTTVLVYTLVWPQFIYSSICLFGATTVSINISVFANKKLTDRTYQFLLVESIVDLLYITMMGCSSLINCGTPCQSRSQTLWAQIIRFCFYEYLTSCFAINNILIEVFLSLERLCVISNRQVLQKCNFKPVILGIACFSLAYYTPVLFMKKFVTDDNGTTYRLVLTSFGTSRAGRLFPGILSFVRLILATIVLFSINMTTFVKFKRHVKKKSKLKGNFQSKPVSISAIADFVNKDTATQALALKTLNDQQQLQESQSSSTTETSRPKRGSATTTSTRLSNLMKKKSTATTEAVAANKKQPTTKSSCSSDSKAKRNLTLMIISVSFLFTLGTLPWAVYYTLSYLVNSSNLYPFQVVASCCLYLLVSFKIFVYYFFNRLFRQVVRLHVDTILTFVRCKRI